MKTRTLMVIAVVALVAAACSSDDTSDTTTTTQATSTTTTTTTTMAETTTTTVAETTTTVPDEPSGAVIEASPIVADLQPYSAGGAELFPGPGQAHWYQWDGLYVVLYRGFDAADGTPICAGNSAEEAAGFNYISNSPHNGTVEEICDGVPKVAEEPSGVFSCGSLLYYLTEIPTDAVANLWGTLEIVMDGATVVDGQTSAVAGDITVTPEFEPGLTAYELPPASVDDLGSISC